jgi:lysophospholipase L1-like esterase
MKKSARNHPVLIALGTIAGLYVLSLAPVEQYRFLGFDLKGVTFSLGPVRTASISPIPSLSTPALPPPVHVPSEVQAPPVLTPAARTPDSPVTAQTPSTAVIVSSAPTMSTVQMVSSVPTLSSALTLSTAVTGTSPSMIVDYGDRMRYFYQALGDYQLRDKGAAMIRIAYVGDSQIEGDVITKDLRSLLQGKYGGAGTGFMKIIAEDAGFRTDMRHTFSGDWTVEALNRDNGESKFWFGPVFISGKGSWVNYDITGKGAAGIDCFLLYQGDGRRHRIKLRANSGPVVMTDLDPSAEMHFLKIYAHAGPALKNITLTFPDAGIRAYGVSFQAETGVYVDNYSLRGHSGLELARVSLDTVSQVRQTSPYKLIILQFGVNVSYPQAGGFKLYEKGISGVIGHIKDLFPESGILVISTTDRCVKDGEAIVSDPCVTDLMKAQQRAAEKEGVAFFDLYHAMGGTGAMNEWVKEGYAVKDYLHINRRGGKKIADLLSAGLLNRGTP